MNEYHAILKAGDTPTKENFYEIEHALARMGARIAQLEEDLATARALADAAMALAVPMHNGPPVTRSAANEATGAGAAALGANCPAVTPGAPYTWEKWTSADGSTLFVPGWK